MFSGFKKSVVALLLGIVGLCAGPVGAQKPPRLLFLGISKDGRPSLAAENAVQLRLGGLDVSVVRSKELPPCEGADCLSTALALEHADLALAGRILKNEHACVATLWLAANNEHEKPLEQDVTCRLEGSGIELVASLADGAAAIVDDYLKGKEPAPALSIRLDSPSLHNESMPSINDEKQRKGRKIKLIGGLSLLLVGGLAATISLASIAPPGNYCQNSQDYCISPAYGIGIGVSAAVTGGAIASLGFLGKK